MKLQAHQLTVLLITMFCATFCAKAQSQSNSAETEVRHARLASNSAIRHHDIKAFAATLDTDFVMVRGNGIFVPSRQAYIDLFTQDFANSNAVRYLRTADKVEVSSAAPLAAEHGHWTGTGPDGKQAYGGTYLAMWRKTPEGWKLRSELFILLECANGPACAGYRKP